MNRRELIAGAAALLGSAHLPLEMTAQQSGAASGKPITANLPEKPRNLLCSIFTPELLSKSLISASEWHPYPKASEREEWQQVPGEIADAVIGRAEKIKGTEWESFPATVFLEYKRDGNRSHFERYYLTRRVRLNDLVLGECVEGKGRFLDEIINGIWLTCEETFWGLPAHLGLQKNHPSSGLPDVEEPVVDLFAAETGVAMSWIHYLLGPQLDRANPMITPRMRFEVRRRILDPAFARDDFLWMFNEYNGQRRHLGNWTSWIDSNWLAAALLLEPDPDRRKAAILKICRSLDNYLDDYSADACCQEGPGYWNVSPGILFRLLHASNLGYRRGGQSSCRPVRAQDVPLHCRRSHQRTLVCRLRRRAAEDGTVRRASLSHWLCHRRQNIAALWRVQCVRRRCAWRGFSRRAGAPGPAIPNVLAYAKAIAGEKQDALVRDSWYPDLGLMTARVIEGSPDGLYLAMQAAPNQRAHGHNDSGSFIVFHDGDPVIVDIGPEAYTAPRYKFSVQSAYHNLPTIGGVMQSNKRANYRAGELRYSADNTAASIEMNLATAYPAEAGIDRWTRQLILDRKTNRIRLNEEFRLQKKVPVQLSLMTPRLPKQGPSGSIVLGDVKQTAQDVTLSYDAALVAPVIEKIDLTDDWLVQRWGKTIYRLLLISVTSIDSGKWAIELS